ncbi:hypothetical protein ACHAWO_008949 [Cyclotella atomus]|uniref:Acyltransferase n=1 Tax=Cyclotella atomus TaxID=382360 RepID=A0ABD3QIA7_9STRA
MKFHKLNLAALPDNLYNNQTHVKKWLELVTSSEDGFAPNSLNQVQPVERDVEIERLAGIAFYMLGNVLPFALPPLLISTLFSETGAFILKFVLGYFTILYTVTKYYNGKFIKKYNRPSDLSPIDTKDNQYLHTERNNQKYLSVQFVWPDTLQRPAFENQPMIFCAIPHGVAPMGITAYPFWSKLFNDKLCHWTCAPVILKIPILQKYMKGIGYIPAKASNISDTLTKKEENVGIILDGIAGMFQSHDEMAYVKKRKGIVKIALRCGVPLVPVYGFGHTSLWKVVVDPFGFLEALSLKLDVSLTPFFGRWFWFLGPPVRVPICICMGDPIKCPKVENPTQEEIDKYHGLLVKGYEQVFEQHKKAYGWGDKVLKFV